MKPITTRPAQSLSLLLTFAFVAALASGPVAGADAGPGPVRIADEVEATIASPQPYPGSASGARELAWSHVIRHPGASYIAVRVAAIDLAPGDELVLTDPTGRYRHVYRGRGLGESGGGFWALSIIGDTMHVSLYTQAAADHGHGGVTIDRIAHGFPLESPPEIDALCGPEDFRDIECYENTYPEAYQKGRAAVRLIKNGAAHCTGWLASCENHIITNQHCVGSQSELAQIEFQFEYKRPECGSGTPTVELQLQGGTLLEVNAGLDYALIMPALAGNDPQATYGFMQWETRLPNVGELMYIPGHPSGDPKRLSIESTHPNDPGLCDVHSISEPTCTGGPVPEVGYYCDTEGGSSGSPVLSYETHKVIALHHCANCPNRGVPIVDVYNNIQASAHPLPACSTCQPAGVPQDLVATSPGDNRIFLDWEAVPGAVRYHIYRSTQSCDVGLTHVGTSTEASYLDEDVGGGITYHYRVTSESICGAESTRSECAFATPSGTCNEPPRFDGLASVTTPAASGCAVDLSWPAATARCGSVRYNVYRSTVPTFEPGAGNLVASCLTATTWRDTDVLSRTPYFYLVRAEDDAEGGSGPCSGGNEERNAVVRNVEARGPDAIIARSVFDGPEAPWQLGAEWQIAVPQAKGGTDGGGLGGPDPLGTPTGPGGALGLDLSGQGAFAGNYENNMSSVATSAAMDTRGHDEVRLRFWRWLSVNKAPADRATLSVCRGTADCREIWSNPTTVDMRDTAWTLVDVDVLEHLADTADARVRFGMASDASGVAAGWTIDTLELYDPTSCSTSAIGVPPVPDGRLAPGTAMTATRAAGGEISLAWDASACASPAYNLFHGTQDGLASYTYTDALCGLSGGSASVELPEPAPGGLVWFVVAGEDGGVEGPHGYTSGGALRPASAGSLCGITRQSTAGTCQ